MTPASPGGPGGPGGPGLGEINIEKLKIKFETNVNLINFKQQTWWARFANETR
jgi:hypothetical protein